MAKINITDELVANHSDEEVIEFLDGLMTGILQNYKTALKSNTPEVLWGNLGDISLSASLIRNIKNRNSARQSQSSSV